ncbi:MAG: PAS domain S-box protein [Candidatus Pacebacteria bacterium]|nr:PAS domain S-box protein [Candidatus Paceibacterota bacterium]
MSLTMYVICFASISGLLFLKAFTTTWIYGSKGEMTIRFVWAFNAWIAFSVVLPRLLYSDLEYLMLGSACMCPLVLLLAYLYTKHQNSLLLAAKIDLLTTDEDCLRVCIAMNRLAAEADEKHGEYMLGAYVAFQQQRKELCIPTREEKGKSMAETRTMMYMLNRIAKLLCTRYPFSVALRIFYIRFLLCDTRNFSLAWALADQSIHLDCTCTQLMILYCIKYVFCHRVVRKELTIKADSSDNGKKSSQFNAIVLMRQSHIEKKFNALVENSARLYRGFWDLLQEKYPCGEQFEQLGFGILQSKWQLEKEWQVLQRAGAVPANVVSLYSRFVEHVEQDKGKAKLVRSCVHTANTSGQIEFLLYHATNGAGVVTISALAKSNGLVRNYNGAFCRLTGYLQDELVNRPMEKLLPSIYRRNHAEELRLRSVLLEAGECDTLTDNEKPVFLLHKSQYLMPVIVKVVVSPNYLNGYVFVATVASNKEWDVFDQVHILLNREKVIVAMTSSIIHPNAI